MHRPPPQLPDDKKQGVDDYLAACGRLEKLEVIGGQLPVADRARAKQVLRHAEENGIKPPRFFERALMVLTAIFARAENGTYKLTRKLLVRATNSDFALVRRCLEDLRETGLITSDVSLEMEPVKTKKGTYYHFPQGAAVDHLAPAVRPIP